jgi:hypothetical protein
VAWSPSGWGSPHLDGEFVYRGLRHRLGRPHLASAPLLLFLSPTRTGLFEPPSLDLILPLLDVFFVPVVIVTSHWRAELEFFSNLITVDVICLYEIELREL